VLFNIPHVVTPVNELVPLTDIEAVDKVPLLFILELFKLPHVALPIFELVDVKLVVSILFAVTIPVNALVEVTASVFVVVEPDIEIEADDELPLFT
jgi:hypothetical protein